MSAYQTHHFEQSPFPPQAKPAFVKVPQWRHLLNRVTLPEVFVLLLVQSETESKPRERGTPGPEWCALTPAQMAFELQTSVRHRRGRGGRSR